MHGFEDWFTVVAGIVMMLAFLTTLVFGRLTMAPMEKKIKQDGHPRPCPWDGPGARIIWYAHAIAVPVGRFNRADNPLINVLLVRNYANLKDKVRAIAMLASCDAFVVVLILFWLLDMDFP